MRVALLEDDPSQAELLSHWLTSAGVVCSRHERGHTLLSALRQERFDALILDWNLPEINGVDVLRHVRAGLDSSVPVLLVSVRSREVDIVTALKQGADDYMVKPVRRMELLARLEAIARRGKVKPQQLDVIDAGDLRVDCRTRTAWRHGQKIDLTAKDYHLLALFLLNVDRLLPRGEIREAVWGSGTALSSRTLDTHVCRIREKVGLTPSNGWRLAAVYGYGYRLQQVAISAAERADPPELQPLSEQEKCETTGLPWP
jgi:DNA-binding response OmpR family regulator